MNKELCLTCGQEIKVKVDDRSLEQLRLYWACCSLIAEHESDNPEFNNKDKVHSQARWGCKFINKESAVHFQTSTGSKLYFELKSISFSKANHKESCHYITDSFDFMASVLGITPEELIKEAKAKMQ